MIKIKFENQTLLVPQDWSEIKLADYERWFATQPTDNKEVIELVASICSIDVQILLDSPSRLFEILLQSVNFVFDADVPASNVVEIDDEKYYVSIHDQLTLGEWVDMESIIAGDSTTKVSEMLGVICRPLAETYDADIAEKRKEMFRQMTCDKALPLLAFFLSKKNELDTISLHYSNLRQQADQHLRDIRLFVKNGGGIKQLPIWQRIKYTYLTKSLERELSRFSDFSFTK